jgi:hypothetical protein
VAEVVEREQRLDPRAIAAEHAAMSV